MVDQQFLRTSSHVIINVKEVVQKIIAVTHN